LIASTTRPRSGTRRRCLDDFLQSLDAVREHALHREHPRVEGLPASYLRIEEREFEARGLKAGLAKLCCKPPRQPLRMGGQRDRPA
jgi:hypothetical protein